MVPGSCRNPLTWLSGLQPFMKARRFAKRILSRNPLTGLSGLQPFMKARRLAKRILSRNPLTGLSGLQQRRLDMRSLERIIKSQSPYGAKWFATNVLRPAPTPTTHDAVAIPLRG